MDRYLKVATIDDLDAVEVLLDMALKDSPYKDKELNYVLVRDHLVRMLTLPNDHLCLLLDDDKHTSVGVLLASVNQLAQYTGQKMACELLWWVHPDYRNSDAAPKMIDAYEWWAKKIGCNSMTMISMENECVRGVDILYRRKGLKKVETTYLKELT